MSAPRHPARANPNPSPGTPGEGRGEGDFGRQARSKSEITLTLTLSRRTGRGDQKAASCQRYLRRNLVVAHRILHPQLRELSLALVGDRQMSQLHQQFMNIAGPTDVLTFPLELDRYRRPTAGEIVICVPEARRRAAERAIPLRQELLLYALHGLLHLCGYDDRTDRDFRRMHRTEDAILIRLGVGPTFARPAPHVSKPPRSPR